MGGSNGAQYAVSKLALVGLTQGLASELGRHGITVNAIAPGPIFTEATKVTVPGPMIEMLLSMTPINRRTEPDGLNGVLLFPAEQRRNVDGRADVARRRRIREAPLRSR